MRQTWRWFGPADSISISELRQVGVDGVVSALHHITPGEIWTTEEISKRQSQISTGPDGSDTGIHWEVVESLVVSEDIKTQTGNWRQHIENYKASLENLSTCGLKTVCYNFMPVLDWTRTVLRSPQPHGGTAMRFDLIEFAVFDIFLLERDGAQSDYSPELLDLARMQHNSLDENEKGELVRNIVAGLPGANENWTLEDVRNQLKAYADISSDRLRENLITFLEHVIPTARDVGINMCCHPDDPPFPLLGLPRIMSSIEDYALVMEAVNFRENGITLCTGSLGVSPTVDFVQFINDWGHRMHFAHLRNTTRDGFSANDKYSFFEAAHLEGDTDMVMVVTALLAEEARRRNEDRTDWEIPMRPDHGQELLSDLQSNSMPGYPLIGRMRGLAELRGIIAAVNAS